MQKPTTGTIFARNYAGLNNSLCTLASQTIVEDQTIMFKFRKFYANVENIRTNFSSRHAYLKFPRWKNRRLSMVLAVAIIGCNESQFGGGAPNAPSPQSSDGSKTFSSSSSGSKTPQNSTDESKDPSSNIPPDQPEDAITRGSFTAYTVPSHPKQFVSYKIVIRVKLPPGKGASYSENDLSIRMTGTDGYFDSFPRPANDPRDPGLSQSFTLFDDEAVVEMTVPGSGSIIKDSIMCQSRLLDESQKIEFFFAK